jgi:hypothetical protein
MAWCVETAPARPNISSKACAYLIFAKLLSSTSGLDNTNGFLKPQRWS